MGENIPPYVMFQKDGRDVCALYQGDPGMPVFWLTYFAVENADESAKKAKALGATVHKKPFDVFDVGRMAVLGDAEGAGFALWQAKKSSTMVKDEVGALCWFELHTTDTKSAEKFYTALFGWKPKAGGDYTEWQVGKNSIGGMMKTHGPEPPNWMIYFMVGDCDAIVKKAKSLGATVYVEPTDIENVGRFAVIADPQGAAFSVIKLK
jgi:hypothetical protein